MVSTTQLPSALPDFIAELTPRIAGTLRTDDYSRLLYSTDASIYQVMPHGVLIPKTVEDVHAAVECAANYKIPILPRTAGSSLAGQTVNTALVIDFSRHLNEIVEINPDERWVRVQPGRVLDELNYALAPHNLQFGPDPASSNRSCLGGNVGNNATGAHSILYGMTADHVLATDVILSDGTTAHFAPVADENLADFQLRGGLEGEIYRQIGQIRRESGEVIRAGTPQHWRRCGGYNLDRFVDGTTFQWERDPRFNLAKLICGSEGTLAVMTEIKLNLVPLPAMTAIAIVPFDALPEALNAVPLMLEIEPSAIEVMDNLGLTMCREVPEYARLMETFVTGEPDCILITEFYGESEAELTAKLTRLGRHLAGNHVACGDIQPILEPARQADVWKVRKVGLGLMMSVKGDYKPIPFIEDAAVPATHLAEYIAKIEAFCHDLGTDVAYYAHASAGCLHVRPLMNTKMGEEVAKLPAIAEFAVELLGDYSGSFSSEHGDGKARSWLNERFFGAELYDLFKQVKGAFDPHNLLNPGNVVDAPAMTESLRYGADYQTIVWQEQLDFSADLGFHRAVEMCNGAGVCRKRTTGTMCPSFMVTREEEHSTRGRANLLRLALSGVLPANELTSPRMKEAMSLCVGCKACSAECPSSVDMAKIKVEWLQNYHAKNGTPLRTRLFSNIAQISRLSSGWLAPLANLGLKNPIVKWGLDRWLGISKERGLPAFATQTFMQWFNRRGRVNAGKPQVVLFVDTVNNYNEPHIPQAATELLESAGFEVLATGQSCCGRPALSNGMIDTARQLALSTLEILAPFAEQKVPIIGLDPSCILILGDDYTALLPNDKRVGQVAGQALLLEAFLADLADAGKLNLTFNDAPSHLLLHGHCHQKALAGMKRSYRALTLPPNTTLQEVDSGCCGMAGAFGYEREHLEISLAMGERRLMPAIRSAETGTVIVASGASCRHQITHATGVVALHPTQFLRDRLRTK